MVDAGHHQGAQPSGHRPVRREDDLVVRPIGDESLVLDLRTDRVTVLDASCAAVWACCDGTRDVAAIGDLAALGSDETRGRLLQLDAAGLLLGQGATRRRLLDTAANRPHTNGIGRLDRVTRTGGAGGERPVTNGIGPDRDRVTTAGGAGGDGPETDKDRE